LISIQPVNASVVLVRRDRSLSAARVVRGIDVGEARRPYRGYLGDVFAGLGPVEMRLSTRQDHHASRRMGGELAVVELFSQADI
jgi:hypothetical protein